MAITVSIQSRNGKELVKGGLQLPEEVKSISTSDALGNLKQNAGTYIHFYYVAARNICPCSWQERKAFAQYSLGLMD